MLAAAIADTRLQLQMLGCNCRTTQLQLQIPNTLCRLSAQEGIGAKTAQLQLQIANTLCRLSAQAKLQRRPPLQIHQKIGLVSRGVRMYCSHLLDAASVLNCRWLYYTQEDANGMYGTLSLVTDHTCPPPHDTHASRSVASVRGHCPAPGQDW